MIKKTTIGLSQMVQYCLDTQCFEETLEAIPNNITIDSISLITGDLRNRERIELTNNLRRMGITSLRKSTPSMEAGIKFVNTPKPAMKLLAKEICNKLGTDYKKIIVSRITLSLEEASVVLYRTKKSINPDSKDQRKKLTVLGVTSSEGNIVDLLRELSAKKFSCTIQNVMTKKIICGSVDS